MCVCGLRTERQADDSSSGDDRVMTHLSGDDDFITS